MAGLADRPMDPRLAVVTHRVRIKMEYQPESVIVKEDQREIHKMQAVPNTHASTVEKYY